MATIPSAEFDSVNFLSSLTDDSWVYFPCNVGDGDSQLILLPADQNGNRRAIVVDAYTDKIVRLISTLTTEGLLPGTGEKDIALVVATHPRQDHISNMPNLLCTHGARVAEFWDPGYFHPISAYTGMMAELQSLGSAVTYVQPTAGLRRWFGGTLLTVCHQLFRSATDSTHTEPKSTTHRSRYESTTQRCACNNATNTEYSNRALAGSRVSFWEQMLRPILGRTSWLTSRTYQHQRPTRQKRSQSPPEAKTYSTPTWSRSPITDPKGA